MPSLREILQPFFGGQQRGQGQGQGQGRGQQHAEQQQQQQAHIMEPPPASTEASRAARRPVPSQRGMNLGAADTANLARGVRLREQLGRRLPGWRSPHDVLRRVTGVGEPAEREFFPTRPPPVSPFPELVLELGRVIDRYVEEREAAARSGAVLPFWMHGRPSMERPDRRMWRPVAEAVARVRDRLLMEGLTRQEQARERELFIDAHGPEALLRLLEPPVVTDAALRGMGKEAIATVAEAYNDVLSLARDLVYFVPDLAPRLATPQRIITLFGLIRHQPVFDHAVGLLEDLLVDSPYTPFLGDVPHLNELLEGLSIRELAHFCRVLALLVFDPQDRFLMESNAVLQSHDILRFRRDRLLSPNPNLDRNVALLLHLPSVLRRLVQLLRIMNHAPPIHVLAASRHAGHSHSHQQQQQQQQQRRRPYELFAMMADMVEQRDWARVERLEAVVASAAARERRQGQQPRSRSAGGGGGGRTLSPSQMMSLLQPILMARVQQRLRFASPDELEMGRVLQLVHHLAEREEADEEDEEEQEEEEDEAATGGMWGGFFRRPAAAPGLSASAASSTSPCTGTGTNNAPAPSLNLTRREAEAELEFYGVSLTAYQTEVLFVLCSLLGGRRKASFQDVLVGQLGLVETLTTMFPRLSWGKRVRHLHHAMGAGGGGDGGGDGLSGPVFVNMETGQVVGLEGLAGLGELMGGLGMPIEVPPDWDPEAAAAAAAGEAASVGSQSSQEGDEEEGEDEEEEEEEEDGEPTRLHGENCNCAPDSALRIQFLRLVHNALDRDDAGAFPGLKSRALGPEERAALLRGDAEGAVAAARAAEGLVAQMVEALCKESKDSSERFWLCSCLEAFLRGSGSGVQQHVAAMPTPPEGKPLVERLLGEVLAEGAAGGALQSAFDLLGELTRAHPAVLARIEAALPDDEAFARLEAIILGSMVDSNVFIRSILLALYGPAYGGEDEEEDGAGRLAAGVGRLAMTPSSSSSGGSSGSSGGVSFLRETWSRPTMGRVSLLASGNTEGDTVLRRSQEEEAWQRAEQRRQRPRPGTAAARALLPRFYTFMQRQWTFILQKLTGSVDFRLVSHESLCVINSAMLMLVLSHRQGKLPAVVAELQAMQQAELAKAGEQAQTRLSWTPEPAADAGEDENGNDAIRHSDFLSNFRALLFFWQEYYTCRGRDRLALEFSSRIPYFEWQQVLEGLCADNGAPTALLSTPIRLPPSPYALPPRDPVLRSAR